MKDESQRSKRAAAGAPGAIARKRRAKSGAKAQRELIEKACGQKRAPVLGH